MTAFQAVQTVTMLLVSRAIENVKNVLKGMAITYYSYSILIAVMLFICLKQSIAIDVKYLILLFAGVILNIFVGISCILSYKQPYFIMNIKDYGNATGQSGVIAGVLGIIITVAM